MQMGCAYYWKFIIVQTWKIPAWQNWASTYRQTRTLNWNNGSNSNETGFRQICGIWNFSSSHRYIFLWIHPYLSTNPKKRKWLKPKFSSWIFLWWSQDQTSIRWRASVYLGLCGYMDCGSRCGCVGKNEKLQNFKTKGNSILITDMKSWHQCSDFLNYFFLWFLPIKMHLDNSSMGYTEPLWIER